MNKLKVGNRVQLKSRIVNWHIDHFTECYYSSSGLDKDYYEEMAMFLLAKKRRSKIKGKVIGFGSIDYTNKKYCVHVELKYKDLKAQFYVEEEDLKKL